MDKFQGKCLPLKNLQKTETLPIRQPRKVVSGHTDPAPPTTPSLGRVGMSEQRFHPVFEGESETRSRARHGQRGQKTTDEPH